MQSFSTDRILACVRRVIRETITPSWLGTVPRDFGDQKEGKLKADEWRILCTIYLPLALITEWGEGTTHANEELAKRSRQLLDHTMELVSAVTIACKRTTSERRVEAYDRHIRRYLREMRSVHPNAKFNTNLHMATHIGDFMSLFGPVYSWWCFPFERLIGFLQKIPSSNKFGVFLLSSPCFGSDIEIGQMETTVHKLFIAYSKIKMWSIRPECPPTIKECRQIYEKLYTDNAEESIEDDEHLARDGYGPVDEDERKYSKKGASLRLIRATIALILFPSSFIPCPLSPQWHTLLHGQMPLG